MVFLRLEVGDHKAVVRQIAIIVQCNVDGDYLWNGAGPDHTADHANKRQNHRAKKDKLHPVCPIFICSLGKRIF